MANKPERRETAHGVSWRLRWRYGGTRTGDRQSVTLDEYADAKALRLAVESRGHMVRATDPEVLDRSIITGHRAAPVAPEDGPTFREVYEDFLATHTSARDSTLRTYRSRVKLLGDWMDRSVPALTDADARALWNALRATGLDARLPFLLAKTVLTHAVKTGLRDDNPCKAVSVPKPRSRSYFLTDEEYALTRKHARTDEDRLVIRTAWESGLRLGEICALQPQDIVIRTVPGRGKRAYITVSRTATRAANGSWTVGPPKSENGFREVAVPLDLAVALLAHAGTRWVFRSRVGGMLVPATVETRWRRLIGRAGLPVAIRFHDLRHSHASNLLMGGADLIKVSRRLGHSSIVITADTYGHISPESDEQILDIIIGGTGRHLAAVG